MARRTVSKEKSKPQRAFSSLSSAEEELNLFKFMADNVSDFVGMCDLDFKPFYVNKSGMTKLGLDAKENVHLIGVRDFFFEEDQEMIMSEFFPRVREEGLGEIEIRFKHFVTGEPIWMLYYVTLLRNSKGQPIGYGTISRDVTKHKLFERAIIESEERFRHLSDNAPMFIWMVDEQAQITYANRELLDFLSIPHYNEVAVQGGWEKVTHPDDIGRVYQAFMTGLTKREGYSVEARLFNSRKNAYEWFLFRATPRFISEHIFTGFIGTAVNINDQKHLLEIQENLVEERTRDLKVANSQLERSNYDLEQFAYIASHDLQEPLRKIQTFAHIIDNRFAATLPADVLGYLKKIIGSAARMSDLIRDLLDYSRLAHNPDSQFSSTDLNKIVSSVLNDFELPINEKQIRIEKYDLPVIEAIPLQMNQLFYNLIGNAIKFSRPGVNSFVRITGDVVPNDGNKELLILAVEDNGIGFSPEYAEQIFTIFQRLNDTRHYGGYGIGLALCRRIAENHGGSITAVGRENEGATFRIVLPVSQ